MTNPWSSQPLPDAETDAATAAEELTAYLAAMTEEERRTAISDAFRSTFGTSFPDPQETRRPTNPTHLRPAPTRYLPPDPEEQDKELAWQLREYAAGMLSSEETFAVETRLADMWQGKDLSMGRHQFAALYDNPSLRLNLRPGTANAQSYAAYKRDREPWGTGGGPEPGAMSLSGPSRQPLAADDWNRAGPSGTSSVVSAAAFQRADRFGTQEPSAGHSQGREHYLQYVQDISRGKIARHPDGTTRPNGAPVFKAAVVEGWLSDGLPQSVADICPELPAALGKLAPERFRIAPEQISPDRSMGSVAPQEFVGYGQVPGNVGYGHLPGGQWPAATPQYAAQQIPWAGYDTSGPTGQPYGNPRTQMPQPPYHQRPERPRSP
ncbi:hypothetical protein [Micromonospora sp. SH-82]|uniref:hypothetical protein n=1 Tax=Micromonospora sp. SH-82 TaxID=3132938 RepID=UPI003EBF6BB3